MHNRVPEMHVNNIASPFCSKLRIKSDGAHFARIEACIETDRGASPARGKDREIENLGFRVLSEFVTTNERGLVINSEGSIDNPTQVAGLKVHSGAGLVITLFKLSESCVELHATGKGTINYCARIVSLRLGLGGLLLSEMHLNFIANDLVH